MNETCEEIWMQEKKEEKKRKADLEKAKRLEKDITERLIKSLDLHLKPCPWCGEEPTIETEIIPEHKAVGFFTTMDYSDPKEYRINLVTCEHLNCTGHHWGTYKIKEIPKALYCNNKYKDYTYDTSWNGGRHPGGKICEDVSFDLFPLTFVSDPEGDTENHIGGYRDKNGDMHYRISEWCRAVMKYQEYLSDDYEYQCCKCHKKWRGYESCGDEVVVDGKSYCTKCCPVYRWDEDGRSHIKVGTYGDMRDLSSLYIQDSAPVYYTS